MSIGGSNAPIPDMQALFDVGAIGGLPDGQLLDLFLDGREAFAFEALVRRHGPMVWGICRRMLRDHHDAEDAFQATFLVLARRAASVRPREKVGHWLHGVAFRTALKTRQTRARRRSREVSSSDLPDPAEPSRDERNDQLSRLDLAIRSLPERYRIPIVLCDLEGRSHKEAAEQLDWPIGTVSGRLSRARVLLARRISSGAVAVPVASLAALMVQEALAAFPATLIRPTARAASLFVAGRAAAAGTASVQVATLAEGVLKSMLYNKLKLLAAGSLLVAVLGVGAVAQVHRIRGSGRVLAPRQGPPGPALARQQGGTPTTTTPQAPDAAAANRRAPMTLLGTLAEWQYPGSALLGGADMSDGGNPAIVDVKCRAVLTTPAPFDQVVAYYAKKFEKRSAPGELGTQPDPKADDARAVFTQDDNREQALSVRLIVVTRVELDDHAPHQPGKRRAEDAHRLDALPTFRGRRTAGRRQSAYFGRVRSLRSRGCIT